MTSTESLQLVKRVNESAKKSPLKVVSPIIKKYSGHRQGKIKKLKFPRILHGGRAKQKKQIKPQLKTILPKTNAGEVIILEPELFPCALNPKKKLKEDENEHGNESCSEQGINGKTSENSPAKDCYNKTNKAKLLPSNKKKIKSLKNIEASLELLESNAFAMKEKREQVIDESTDATDTTKMILLNIIHDRLFRSPTAQDAVFILDIDTDFTIVEELDSVVASKAFVENYLLRVQQKLKGNHENVYSQFLDLICNFQANGLSVCDLYKNIKILFHSHLDLCEDFVAFLTPKQAVECGVFMDHLLLTTMSDFLSMIDIYFSKSPQQIRKIHSVLESLANKSNITTEYVTDTVLPLLKGNPVLRDYFLRLLPGAKPPDNLLTDFEEVEYPELNSDMSDDEEVMETVHLPDIEDPYGGDLCPCKCHDAEDEKFKSRSEHCISCSLKFINGKIFIQQGKLLKPARVVFADHDMNYHRDRLTPKLYPKRNQKRHRNALFKDNSSPTKSCNLSSDEFKSDIEDEEKGRLKFASSKSPRMNRKKSVSPKHGEKILPKCILNDSKPEVDFDGKSVFIKCLDLAFKEEEKLSSESKMDVDETLKNEQCDFIKFFCDTREQQKTTSPSCKPLDLQHIDKEDRSENPVESLNVVLLNDLSKKDASDANKNIEKEPPVFINKEGSHSPPVISIPETATPLFSEAKPILSFLEKLDDSKDSQIILDSTEEKILNIKNRIKPTVKEEEVRIEERKLEENPWKIEEDRVILQTLQVEENCEETFVKIGKNIPSRSVDDIKKRFEELMNMFYEMKAKTNNS